MYRSEVYSYRSLGDVSTVSKHFLPSLYHFSSASSLKIFIDETEKSWKVYPSCSSTSFVPSKHIRRIRQKKKKRCNIESSFQKTTYSSPKTHPPKLSTTSLCFSWLLFNNANNLEFLERFVELWKRSVTKHVDYILARQEK